jgi:hypothetical protein
VLFLVGALGILTAWSLPWIVGQTALKEQITYAAMPWLPPGADFETPKASWTSPVQLAQVRLLDKSGQPFFECEKVISGKTLWEMATSKEEAGRWTLEGPHLTIRATPEGTNLGSVIRDALQFGGGGHLLPLDITATSGRIDILDDADRPLGVIDDVDFQYVNSPDGGKLDVHGRIPDPQNNGKVEIAASWKSNTTSLSDVAIQAAIDGLPVAVFTPALRDRMRITEVQGSVSTILTAKLTPDGQNPASLTAEIQLVPAEVSYLRSGEAPGPYPVDIRQLTSHVAGQWQPYNDRLTITSIDLESEVFKLRGEGLIDRPRGAGMVRLQGVAEGNFDALATHIFRPDGPVAVDDLRPHTWSIFGAIRPEWAGPDIPGLTIQSDLIWKDATLFGISAIPGSVTTEWTPGRIALQPQGVKVNGGQLAALPDVILGSATKLLAPKGPMLIDVQFTDEQCRGWLKFLSPLMADATNASGSFTLEIEQGEWPLGKPDDASVAGIIHIHSGRIGPGPLAHQAVDSVASLAELVLRRAPNWNPDNVSMELPEQDVKFAVKAGRVYHEAMTFRAGDVDVISTGSVGLDQTLNVEFRIPLPDRWLDRGPILTSLRGESIVIAVSGTLQDPVVDTQALADLGKRIGAKAAGGLLQKLLERGSQ